MSNLATTTTILAVLGSGVMAGLFFTFSNTIMKALSQAPDDQGAVVMQSINVVIVNPVFLLLFLGTGVFQALYIGLSLVENGLSGTRWTIASGLLYLVGCLFITMKFNVPLNNMLAAFDASLPESAIKWRDYLASWIPWNHARTIAAVGATVTGCIALANG